MGLLLEYFPKGKSRKSYIIMSSNKDILNLTGRRPAKTLELRLFQQMRRL